MSMCSLVCLLDRMYLIYRTLLVSDDTNTNKYGQNNALEDQVPEVGREHGAKLLKHPKQALQSTNVSFGH